MKRTALTLAATALATGFYLGTPGTAQATGTELTTPNGPTGGAHCPKLASWTVNGDETDRRPTATVHGLKFEATDLIHHATSIALADLKPGTFAVVGAGPDQPSFFSVEVRNTTGAYGTVRWNPTTLKWLIVIGAGTGPDGAATDGAFENADPVTLLTGKVTKWGKFDVTTAKVVSFGVGYTKTPPGTVPVTVKSVTFQGTTYFLTCPPVLPSTSPTSASASPSASIPTKPPVTRPTTPATTRPTTSGTVTTRPTTAPTTSPTPAATTEETTPPPAGSSDGGSLPLTGAPVGLIAGGAMILVGTGAALFVVARRRKMNFTA